MQYLYTMALTEHGEPTPALDVVLSAEKLDVDRDRMFVLQLFAQQRVRTGATKRDLWAMYERLKALDADEQVALSCRPLAAIPTVRHDERAWAREMLKI